MTKYVQLHCTSYALLFNQFYFISEIHDTMLPRGDGSSAVSYPGNCCSSLNTAWFFTKVLRGRHFEIADSHLVIFCTSFFHVSLPPTPHLSLWCPLQLPNYHLTEGFRLLSDTKESDLEICFEGRRGLMLRRSRASILVPIYLSAAMMLLQIPPASGSFSSFWFVGQIWSVVSLWGTELHVTIKSRVLQRTGTCLVWRLLVKIGNFSFVHSH